MGYRRDEDGLRVRIEELEGELADAQRTIARLRGEADVDPSPSDAPDWFTGVPMHLHREVQLPFGITNRGFVAISDFLCARIPGGSASQIGDTLTHRKASYEMRIVRSSDGRSCVRLKGDYRPARLQLGLGTPGLALLGAVFALPIAVGLSLGPVGIVMAGLMGAAAGFFFLRELLRKAMAKDRRQLEAAFEGVVEIAGGHRVPGARIAANADAEERTAETEATAVEEAASAGVSAVRRAHSG